MDLSLHHFRAVVVLAEELHFGRAAKRLGMAQPHLSTLIRRIESSVGTRLFTRQPRVALTPAGEVMVYSARRVLAEVEMVLERIRHVTTGQVGSVSVGFTSTVMLTELPTVFEAFGRQHKGIDLRLREMHSAPQVDALRSGLIDVAFTREIPSDRQILTELIQREEFIVALPASHRLGGESTISVAELAEEPFVMFRREVAPTLYDQIIRTCTAAGFGPRIVQEADEWHTILALVRSGFGVTLAPASVRLLAWPGLTFRNLHVTLEHASIALCWISAGLSPAAALFVEFTRTHGNGIKAS